MSVKFLLQVYPFLDSYHLYYPPPELRLRIFNLIATTSEELIGPPNAAQTLHSRIEHHVEWCNDMPIDLALPCKFQSDRNKVMAFCTLHLA